MSQTHSDGSPANEEDYWDRHPHVQIGDDDFVVTTRPGESPMCSICHQMLVLVFRGKMVTCDIKIERRARDGCHVCEFFLLGFDAHATFFGKTC
jgi:hypothetical protein